VGIGGSLRNFSPIVAPFALEAGFIIACASGPLTEGRILSFVV
jgi:hypothetical protein